MGYFSKRVFSIKVSVIYKRRCMSDGALPVKTNKSCWLISGSVMY